MGFFSKGLKNEFETARVNEPSVFEPLKFYFVQKDLANDMHVIDCQFGSSRTITIQA